MIRFVKNGVYRTLKVVIRRMVGTQEITGDGFPVTEDLLEPFGNYGAVSEEDIIDMDTTLYNNRVSAFTSHLAKKYPFLTVNDFTNQASGIDDVVCVPGEIVKQSEVVIDEDTMITIYFDSSGSMNATLEPLNEMRNTLLKDALLPFYNNDEALFDEKVKVLSERSERTMWKFNNRGNDWTDPHLIMVFQDEAYPVYTDYTTHEPRKLQFDTDITNLHAKLDSLSTTYRGIMFQVDRTAGDGVMFRSFIEAVQFGQGSYALQYGLSGRNEFEYQYDVVNGGSPQYYMDLIISKMRQLGYRI